jgi:hypothetical protein
MGALLGIGVVVMIVADAVVGLRLLWLACHTRRLPELGLGTSLVGLGALGYPISIAARSGAGGSPETDELLLAAAMAFQNLGCASMAVANVATFHPKVGWARALAGLVAVLLAGSWGVQVASGDFAHHQPGGSTAYWVGLGARALPFLWAAACAWEYHGQLRRRLRLGLTDAVVTDRFRLWAISATGVVCAFSVFTLGIVSRVDVATSAWVLAPTSLAGLVSGVTLWLAFLPPRWYLRRIEPTPAA